MNPSKSQRILRLNPRYTQLSLNNPNEPISNKHPSSFLLLNFGNNNKSSNNKLSFMIISMYFIKGNTLLIKVLKLIKKFLNTQIFLYLMRKIKPRETKDI